MAKHMVRLSVVFLVVVILTALAAYAQGVPPAQAASPDGVVKLPPEAWFVLIGAAVSVGVNLGLLYSLRSDVKDLKTSMAKMPDEYVRRDYWKERIEGIEEDLRETREIVKRLEYAWSTVPLSGLGARRHEG